MERMKKERMKKMMLSVQILWGIGGKNKPH